MLVRLGRGPHRTKLLRLRRILDRLEATLAALAASAAKGAGGAETRSAVMACDSQKFL